MRFFSLLAFSLLTAALPASAATIALNISMGNLFDAGGTGAGNRLPDDTLFVLVADIGDDGFDPVPADGWVGGTDLAVLVYDTEFPASGGGVRGFDLSSGVTDNGFFSRTLIVDTAQFGALTNVKFALRWFPGVNGSSGLPATGPGQGQAYGEFSRFTPKYGQESWDVTLTGGSSYTLDPFVTPDQGGTDAPADGVADLVTVPEPTAPGMLLLAAGSTLFLRRRARRTA